MDTAGPAIASLAAHRSDLTRMSPEDLWLWNQGRHFQIERLLGAHLGTASGARGAYFGVWAPNAEAVSVVGDFNNWDVDQHPLHRRDPAGLWEGFIGGVDQGARYQYYIRSRVNGYRVFKADPVAFYSEVAP